VPLKEGKDALLVSWAELTILDKEGNILKTHFPQIGALISPPRLAVAGS